MSTPRAPTLCAATMSYSGASPTTTTGPAAAPARRRRAGQPLGAPHADADGPDLVAKSVGADDEHIRRPRVEPLEVVRGGVCAGDDMVLVAAEPEPGQARDVFGPRGRRVVRREE